MTGGEQRRRPLLLVLLAALAAHGLLLLNGGVYWDGWIYHVHFENGDWLSVYDQFRDYGRPVAAWFHRLMHVLPATVFCYRLLVFAAAWLGGTLAIYILRELRIATPGERVWIGCLCATYPVYQVGLASTAAFPFFLQVCFLGGAYLALRTESLDGRHRSLARAGAWAALLLSFELPSLAVFHLAFLALWLLHTCRGQSAPWWRPPARFLLRHVDYLLLPFLHWLFSRLLFPPRGVYEDYNPFDSTWSTFAEAFADGFESGVFGQLWRAVVSLGSQPIVLVATLLVVVVLSMHSQRDRQQAGDQDSSIVLLGGLALVVAALLPYAVVGKAAGLSGWQMRHAQLIAIPLPLLLVVLARSVARPLPPRPGAVVHAVLLSLLLAGFCIANAQDYASWQLRWIKDRAVVARLAAMPELRRASVFLIDDRFPAGRQDHYRFYEWTALFHEAWGEASRIGLDVEHYDVEGFLERQRRLFTPRYLLAGFDPLGCQTRLTLRPGPAADRDRALVRRYLLHRLWKRDRMPELLAETVRVEAEAWPSPLAVHCPEDPDTRTGG